MIYHILLASLSFLGVSACLGCFLRIRNDIAFLKAEKEKQVELVQRLMKDVVTQEQMEHYLQSVEHEITELSRYKDKYSKERWANYHKAFGGKKEEAEENL